MSDGSPSPRFALHFEGAAARLHKVPAGALVQALSGLQRSIFLLAMSLEGYEVAQRARVSQAIERRYSVLCELSEEGGFVQPYQIGDPNYALFDANLIAEVTEKHEQVLKAIDRNDQSALRSSVPDSFYRNGVINALWKMQPPERSGLILHVESRDRIRLLDGQSALIKLRSLASARQEPLVSPGVVTGELIELRFQERQLRLQTIPSGRTLTAAYADDFEPMLLENPRQLVQIRGNIVFDEDGETPNAVTSVQEIVEIDISPITMERFVVGNTTYLPTRPIIFDVSFSRQDGVYYCEGPFGIITVAETRSRLEDVIDDEVKFLWSEYSLSPDDDLASSGLALKRELQDAFKEE